MSRQSVNISIDEGTLKQVDRRLAQVEYGTKRSQLAERLFRAWLRRTEGVIDSDDPRAHIDAAAAEVAEEVPRRAAAS